MSSSPSVRPSVRPSVFHANCFYPYLRTYSSQTLEILYAYITSHMCICAVTLNLPVRQLVRQSVRPSSEFVPPITPDLFITNIWNFVWIYYYTYICAAYNNYSQSPSISPSVRPSVILISLVHISVYMPYRHLKFCMDILLDISMCRI